MRVQDKKSAGLRQDKVSERDRFGSHIYRHNHNRSPMGNGRTTITSVTVQFAEFF